MRIGIMGGTLDPIHNGHIDLARTVLRNLQLDGVMLLPAGDPPHKSRTTSKEDRWQMVCLAAAEEEGLFPCGIEINRGGTTYTIDTLKELKIKNPSTQWFYIIGSDTLNVLDTWRNFDQVAQLCTFAVCGRADEDASIARMEELARKYGARFVSMNFNGPDISSTDIRNAAISGKDISDLVPESVAGYIEQHGLYLSPLSGEDISAKLKKTLKPGRFVHTIGVAETARRLAPQLGISPARAWLAGMLHDCAKYLAIDEMRSMVQAAFNDVDALEMDAVSVLHAPAGAVFAQKEYGIEDPVILSAIRKHTLGDANMSPLDALIYTADFIEPNREEFPGLSDARALAERDIYAAMCLCGELTNRHLQSQGRCAHPKSLAMIKHYKSTSMEDKT